MLFLSSAALKPNSTLPPVGTARRRAVAAAGLITLCAAGFWFDPIARVSYATERGRLQADKEHLTAGDVPAHVATLDQISRAYHLISETIKPSVVKILAKRDSSMPADAVHLPFGRMPETNIGSGVVVDSEGYIVTSNHVVDDAETVSVEMSDGREYDARVVGTDPATDLALLKINADRLHPADFGNSDETEVGHIVLAIGTPFRLAQSVSHGIVSAKGRKDVAVNIDYQDFIQTDAPINPGNSGGPLVNTRGRVIGINTAIATESGSSAGVGFATPSNRVLRVIESLKQSGRVIRGYLGIRIGDLSQSRPEERSRLKVPGRADAAIISDVVRDSPADKAGLRPNDAVLAMDGRSVTNTDMLREMIAAATPGSKHEFRVWRDGAEKVCNVEIGEQSRNFRSRAPLNFSRPDEDDGPGDDEGDPDESDGDEAPPEFVWNDLFQPRTVNVQSVGIDLRVLTPRLAREYGVDNADFDNGLVITNVASGSLGATAGLRPGQVVLSIDGKRTRTIADLSGLLSEEKLAAGVDVRLGSRDGIRTIKLRSND